MVSCSFEVEVTGESSRFAVHTTIVLFFLATNQIPMAYNSQKQIGEKGKATMMGDHW